MPEQHFINFQTFEITLETLMSSEPLGAVYIKGHRTEPTEKEFFLVMYSIVHTGYTEFRTSLEGEQKEGW